MAEDQAPPVKRSASEGRSVLRDLRPVLVGRSSSDSREPVRFLRRSHALYMYAMTCAQLEEVGGTGSRAVSQSFARLQPPSPARALSLLLASNLEVLLGL